METFREYYTMFSAMTLGEYENWPDERWADVSRPEWRAYLVDTLAKELYDKGVDGFFLDNTDVWYQYPREKIYFGLKEILRGLGKYELPLIINGGDCFVTRLLEESGQEGLDGLIAGVNQETVFTAIQFETGGFGTQSKENTEYFKEYLARCKGAGLKVYLTEYGAGEELREKIRRFCREKGYAVYFADSLLLD